MRTVYYIVHKDSGQRLKYYKTRAGARIAQRARNSHLGFRLRLERIVEGDQELELCANGLATYTIVEDSIESNEGSLVDYEVERGQ
jgi:hypothetical protein